MLPDNLLHLLKRSALWLCACVLGFAVLPLGAQDNEDPATLPAEVLLKRAQTAIEAEAAVAERFAELQERAAQIAQEQEANAIELQAFTLPEAPVVETPPTDPEQVQIILDNWETHLKGLEQLKTLTEKRRSLAQQHRDSTLLLAEEAQLLATAKQNAAPLLTAIERRLEAGELPAAELPEAIVQYRQAEAAELPDPGVFKTAANRDAVAIEEAETRLAEFDAAIEQAIKAEQQVSVWFQEANQRAQLRQEYEGQLPADAAALLSSRLPEWETADAGLRELLADLESKVQAVAEQEAALEQLLPPSPDAIVVEGNLESLRKAKHAAQLAEANVAYRGDRVERMEALQGTVKALLETLEEVGENAAEVFNSTLELDVLAGVIQTQIETGDAAGLTLPQAVAEGGLTERLAELRTLREQLQNRQATRTQQLTELGERIEQAQTALEDAQQAVTEQTQALEREQEWAAFIDEMRALDSAELIQTFEESVAQYAEARENLDTSAARLEKFQTWAQEAAAELENHYDPVVLAMTEQTEAFAEWREEQGLRLAVAPDADQQADQAAEPAPDEQTATAAETTAEPAAADDAAAVQTETAQQVQQWLTGVRDLRDQTVSRRLSYFQERQKLQGDLIAELQSYEQRLDAHRQAVTEVFELARRAWGSATTLQVRAARGDLDASTLPAALEEWTARDRVTELQLQLNELNRRGESAADRREQILDAVVQDDFVDPLAAWRDNLAQQIERFADYLTLEEQAALATRDIESLDELERNVLERQIRQRIAEDFGVYDALDDVFVSQKTETIDTLLQRYYERLILLERRIDNFENRKTELDALLQLAEANRPFLEQLAKAVRAQIQAAQTQLDVSKTRIKAALQPAKAPELLTALQEKTGVKLELGTLPELPTEGGEEALREAQNELIQSLLQPWGEVAGYQAWLNQIEGRLAKLGGIDMRIGELKDLKARLDADQMELQRKANRLIGYDESELESLLATGQPLPQQERERLLRGEIGLLQLEHRQELHWIAANSVVALIVIPIVALLLILLVRRIGWRMVTRASRESEDNKHALTDDQRREREERATTLFDIFQAIWTGLIIVLAAIYMLKAVNIDVTPIIASLGIFGLAVAFGAQSIMKDLFAGFFILLENQLNRGDYVTINGLVAQVEKIGLRLTVLRDWNDGQAHFIPNGQINMVSNFNKGWAKARILISVMDDTSPDEVINCLKAIAEEMKNDSSLKNLRDISVQGGVYKFDPEKGAMIFRVYLEVINASTGLGREYRRRVKLAFDKAGIKLARPQRLLQIDRSDMPVTEN